MKTGIVFLSALLLAGSGSVLAQQPGQQPGQPGQPPGQQQPGQQQPGQQQGQQPDAAQRADRDRQASPGDRRQAGDAISRRGVNQIRSEELVGSDVLDSSGETVGNVDELLIDDDGKVSALLVSVGGVLGVGGRTVAISWDDADIRRLQDDGMWADQYEVRISMTQQQIENSPEFQDEADNRRLGDR